MPSLSSILYDKRTKEYLVRVKSSSGLEIEAKQRFKTQAEAQEFLANALRQVGADPGEIVPRVKS